MNGAVIGVYASVPDPVTISFAPDGTLYCGRDASGSGGGPADAVKIHKIAPGGSSVVEFGDMAISDPDAVIVDAVGTVSGTPGAVIVGGVHTIPNQGKLSKISPDGTVTNLFRPGTAFENPSAFDFDQSGRLVFSENSDGSVQVTSGGAPTVLFSLANAFGIAVDALDRIVVGTSAGGQLRLYSSSGTLSKANFAVVKPASPLARGPGGSWGTDVYAISALGHLLRIDPTGNVTTNGSGFDDINDIEFGPDGELYVSDFTADRIYRFGQPTVPGANTTVYAMVPDPVQLSFATDGSLFVGRDASGSGGTRTEPVRFHRVAPGGASVVEYPNTAISDADAVYYDATGQFTGIPGAVLAGGLEADGTGGKLVNVLTNGTVVTNFVPLVDTFNPNLFVHDPVHSRLLFSDDSGDTVWVMTNTTPVPLFSLADAFPVAVDSLGRIVATGYGPSLNLFDADGMLLTNGFATVQPRTPITTGPGGFWGTGIYAVDDLGKLISITTDGSVSTVGTQFGFINSLSFGPDGALYASQLQNDLVWRIGPGEAVPSLEITGITANLPDALSISFTSLPGNRYGIETSTGLSALFAPLETIVATDTNTTYVRTNVTLLNREFFRVENQGNALAEDPAVLIGIDFDGSGLVNAVMVEVHEDFLKPGTMEHSILAIEITSLNGAFHHHGSDNIPLTEVQQLSQSGDVFEVIMTWTEDTVPITVGDIYTVCVRLIVGPCLGPEICDDFFTN